MLNNPFHIALTLGAAILVIALCAVKLEPAVAVGIALLFLAFHPAIP